MIIVNKEHLLVPATISHSSIVSPIEFGSVSVQAWMGSSGSGLWISVVSVCISVPFLEDAGLVLISTTRTDL